MFIFDLQIQETLPLALKLSYRLDPKFRFRVLYYEIFFLYLEIENEHKKIVQPFLLRIAVNRAVDLFIRTK